MRNAKISIIILLSVGATISLFQNCAKKAETQNEVNIITAASTSDKHCVQGQPQKICYNVDSKTLAQIIEQ